MSNKNTEMTNHLAIHIARNPYGWSGEKRKEARERLANIVEQLEKRDPDFNVTPPEIEWVADK